MDKIIPIHFEASFDSQRGLRPTSDPELFICRVRAFYKYSNRNGSYITDEFAKELADAQLQEKLIKDPDYRAAYFASTIGNLSAAAVEYSFTKYKYSLLSGAYKEGMLDEDTIKVFTMLEDLGFEGTSTYESMLQSVIDNSNLTTYLMGRGFKIPYLLPDASSTDPKTSFYTSIKNWNVNMEKIRYDAMKPFLRREDIKFGIDKSIRTNPPTGNKQIQSLLNDQIDKKLSFELYNMK